MNDEKHLRELIQAVLDGKVLQYYNGKEYENRCLSFERMMRNVIDSPLYFRLAPAQTHTIEYTE
jgi:hypothetical protein